jgi:hypothetical protein
VCSVATTFNTEATERSVISVLEVRRPQRAWSAAVLPRCTTVRKFLCKRQRRNQTLRGVYPRPSPARGIRTVRSGRANGLRVICHSEPKRRIRFWATANRPPQDVSPVSFRYSTAQIAGPHRQLIMRRKYSSSGRRSEVFRVGRNGRGEPDIRAIFYTATESVQAAL